MFVDETAAVYSFRDRMDAARDEASWRREECRMPVVIRKRPPARVAWYTVPEVAAQLRVTETFVKRILGAGRIDGARRGKGRNRPWRVPAHWDGASYVLTVKAPLRGPQASWAGNGAAVYSLSPTREEVPF